MGWAIQLPKQWKSIVGELLQSRYYFDIMWLQVYMSVVGKCKWEILDKEKKNDSKELRSYCILSAFI